MWPLSRHQALKVNPFHAAGLLLFLQKKNRKPLVFWCFQGVKKRSSGMKWAKTMPNRNTTAIVRKQFNRMEFCKNSESLCWMWLTVSWFGKFFSLVSWVTETNIPDLSVRLTIILVHLQVFQNLVCYLNFHTNIWS